MNTGMAILHKPGNHCKDQLPIGRGVVVFQPQHFEAQTPPMHQRPSWHAPNRGKHLWWAQMEDLINQTKIVVHEHKVH